MPAMQDDAFEWDDEKARSNLIKHDIDFEEAKLAFMDPRWMDEPDDSMDYGEERYRALGMVNGRLLAVIYTPRGRRSRIISARMADRLEQREYARQNPPG
jgi:uncharacterized protein